MPKITGNVSEVLPPSWAIRKGDIFVNRDGYPMILWEGRWQLAHRAVAERALGRELRRCEVVHHVYGDKKDYRNLVICTPGYHHALHRRCERMFGTWHLPKPRRKNAAKEEAKQVATAA